VRVTVDESIFIDLLGEAIDHDGTDVLFTEAKLLDGWNICDWNSVDEFHGDDGILKSHKA
jgi:hypothetical protein